VTSDYLPRSVSESVADFMADLRAKAIHVGIGHPPKCVVDDEDWPCSYVRPDEHEFVRQPHKSTWAGCAICGKLHLSGEEKK
jgi:hypothetical protein